MKKFFLLISAVVCFASTWVEAANNELQFDPAKGEHRTITMVDGSTVNYVAYEQLYYVTNVEDPNYQYLNIYVPDGATSSPLPSPLLSAASFSARKRAMSSFTAS